MPLDVVDLLKQQWEKDASLITIDRSTGRVETLRKGCFAPQWSPDGRRIACIDAETKALTFLDPKSGKLQDVGVMQCELAGEFPDFAWSHDSERLFAFTKSSKTPELVLVQIETGSGNPAPPHSLISADVKESSKLISPAPAKDHLAFCKTAATAISLYDFGARTVRVPGRRR